MSRASREVEKQILTLLHGRNTRTHLTEIHAHTIRHNLHQSNLILTQLVSVCGSLHKTPYAHLIFLQTQTPNLLLFNSMIKAFSLSTPSHEPLKLFSLMKTREIFPDQYTFAPLLKSCTNLYDQNFGRILHAEVLSLGFESHKSIQIGLVEFYASCEQMDNAKKVFDFMSQRDVIVWNIMIRGLCKGGNVDSGVHLFRQMSERSNVSWNTMIAGLAQSGRDSEALQLFHEMWNEGFEPDDATLVTILPICARLGLVENGSRIHSYVDSRPLLKKFVHICNALLDFYCKCGNLKAARKLFHEMPHRSVISWNTMISGLGYNGQGKLGVEVFKEMRRQGVNPNNSTFVGVLSCCAHAGLVQKGRELFDLMTKEYKMKPKLEHYGCMVDLLGRGGCIKEARELIDKMPMRPNAAIWGALLSACRLHGNLDLAECAVKELIHLEPGNSGNYTLLSNIYAELGKWDEVEKARELMKERCVLKVPGESVVT